MGHQPRGVSFSAYFGRRLAERESLALGEDVRHEDVVVNADVVQRLREGDQVAGHWRSSLMDHLIERVLAVGAGFAPNHGAGLPAAGSAVELDTLAV